MGHNACDGARTTNTYGSLIRPGNSLPNLHTGLSSIELSHLNLRRDYGKLGTWRNAKFSCGWPSKIDAGLQTYLQKETSLTRRNAPYVIKRKK
jgi:hypothetical protein